MIGTTPWKRLQSLIASQGFELIHEHSMYNPEEQRKADVYRLFLRRQDALVITADSFGTSSNSARLHFEIAFPKEGEEDRWREFGEIIDKSCGSNPIGERKAIQIDILKHPLEVYLQFHEQRNFPFLSPWVDMSAHSLEMADRSLLNLITRYNPKNWCEIQWAMEERLRSSLPSDVKELLGYKRK